jgi:hypothetical protein
MPLLQLNIRGKLLLLFFALALVPMAAVGVIAYFNSVGSVEKVVEQRNLATVREVADNVQRQFELRPSEIALLARNQEIQDFYALYATAGTATAGFLPTLLEWPAPNLCARSLPRPCRPTPAHLHHNKRDRSQPETLCSEQRRYDLHWRRPPGAAPSPSP